VRQVDAPYRMDYGNWSLPRLFCKQQIPASTGCGYGAKLKLTWKKK
jgi:hypothetical protein